MTNSGTTDPETEEAEQTNHYLHREVVATRQEQLFPNSDGGLTPEAGEGALVDFREKKTIECSCGERFRKERTALEHLHEEGVYEEQQRTWGE